MSDGETQPTTPLFVVASVSRVVSDIATPGHLALAQQARIAFVELELSETRQQRVRVVHRRCRSGANRTPTISAAPGDAGPTRSRPNADRFVTTLQQPLPTMPVTFTTLFGPRP